MGNLAGHTHAFVVKAEELPALYFLEEAHPRPLSLEWINRGTDQKLRRSTIEMLLRTLFMKERAPSVRKLHNSSGLRASFQNERERERFAQSFHRAVDEMTRERGNLITATFDQPDGANRAIGAMKKGGVPEDAIAMVWRASEYLEEKYQPALGHSTQSVAGSIAGAGIAGAVLGVGVLMIPGIGPVAVAGAISGATIAPVAAVSSVIGATGGAIAKMLSDHDVDGISATRYEREISRGKVFLSVHGDAESMSSEEIRQVLSSHGGHLPDE